mmetsp:Transcript_18517/g.27448  ORF Transcript_18517/g.27448 Transcript_18517/m.27448 type:complete len:246 (+) Transcript_18517:1894-2631(+)
MNFNAQAAQEKFLRSGPLLPTEVNRIRGEKRSQTYGKASDAKLDTISKVLQDSHFDGFAKDAYASEHGYAIRVNPNTGEKEMFIAGTRHGVQWGLNLLDTVLYTGDSLIDKEVQLFRTVVFDEFGIPLPNPGHAKILAKLDVARDAKEEYFAEVAKANHVQVIYGHSRGGAIASDIAGRTGARAIGLDAAMSIAHNKDTLNVNEGHAGSLNPKDYFDALIGLTGKNNQYMDFNSKIHTVWSSGDD